VARSERKTAPAVIVREFLRLRAAKLPKMRLTSRLW
jgi:hypothetical protein